MSTRCTIYFLDKYVHLYRDYHDDRVYLDLYRFGCVKIPKWFALWKWGFGDEYVTWGKNYKKRQNS